MILSRYTEYLKERPIPPLNPPLVHSRNNPPPQATQRWAGGTARNNGELEPTDTVNTSMNYIYDIQPCLAN